jgi:MFS family permease
MRSQLLLALAIVIFGIAQFLPALSPDMGAWNNPESKDFPGFLITLLVWPYYLSNTLLILGPLLLYLFKRFNRSRNYYIGLIVFYLLTPLSSIALKQYIYHASIGFYLWIATYCIAATGILLALLQKQKADKMLHPTAGNVLL